MDNETTQLLTFIAVIAFVLIAVLRHFLNIFVKPILPKGPPGGPQGRSGQIKDLLDELRRDLGHGNLPPPRTDGLLEDEGASREAPPFPPRGPSGRTYEMPYPPPLPSAPPPRARPRPQAPRPLRELEKVAKRLGERIERMGGVRERGAAVAPPAAGTDPWATSSSTVGEVHATDPTSALRGMSESKPREDLGLILGTDIETAVVLREILGPPRALRGRSRRI